MFTLPIKKNLFVCRLLSSKLPDSFTANEYYAHRLKYHFDMDFQRNNGFTKEEWEYQISENEKNITHITKCDHCNGKGLVTCFRCNGTGTRYVSYKEGICFNCCGKAVIVCCMCGGNRWK